MPQKKRVDSIEKLKNVYYLYGDEELLMEQSLRRLENLLAGEADTDFNLEVLSGTEAGAERIIDSARTVPMMCLNLMVNR